MPDVFAEGMLFNGLKLYSKGEPNEAMWNFIRDNTRAAGQLVGDLEAQIASAGSARSASWSCIETYGKDTVFGDAKQLMDYTERLLRREIAKIPDGDYVAEGFLDDDGRNRDQRCRSRSR